MLDIAIVGTGLAGIGAAARFVREVPDKRIGIFEQRAAIGGTWDLFRYPGVRSDSDMYTLAYDFRPWASDEAIVNGEDIRAYIEATARDHDLGGMIRFDHRLLSADWSTSESCWHLRFDDGDDRGETTVRARLIYMATGYYDYDAGYRPKFDGEADFAGSIIHPQHWPGDADVEGRRVAIIGSGATAVTLAPALAAKGAQVTLVQRSPGYVATLPRRSTLARVAYRHLPDARAFRLIRLVEQRVSAAFFRFCRRWPKFARRFLVGRAAKALGDAKLAGEHFNPSYDPWMQRVCVAADGDLFDALRSGTVEMATGRIERFERHGIRMKESDALIPCDTVVTATGLRIALFGKAVVSVDGVRVRPPRETIYKGLMLSGVPNMIFVFGYTNASWTLKADLVARYTVRLIREMDRRGARVAKPGQPPDTVERVPMTDFSSGYFRRSAAVMPRQGTSGPWTLPMDYRADRRRLLRDAVDDGVIAFR